MEVRVVEMKSNNVIEDITGYTNKKDYQVVGRYWVRSDSTLIREWTAHEYIYFNPRENVILSVKVNESYIDVLAHCVELRTVPIYKDDIQINSFHQMIDYSKSQ